MQKALIVIDVQKYFLNEDTKKIVRKIQKYLSDKSNQYDKIYFTIFKNDPSGPVWQISKWKDCTKSPDTDICDEIQEFVNDKNLFYKNFYSALKVPKIKEEIIKNNIQEVHLCGFDTDCCVLATAYDLFDQGIKPVILEDLTYSTSYEKLQESAIKMIKRNIGFTLNTEKS
ncbi:MAG: isochorismatase family cysteine hydrolase [Nanoarchaeota archaeon]